MTSSSSAASCTGSRTGRSGRASSRTRSGRSATPGRRWASRRRRRTARRAGGSSRRCRSRAPSGAYPAATAAAEPPLEPPGHARRVVRVAGGPERRVLGGRAHRELVEVGLGHGDRARPRATRSTTVAVYGGRQPSRMRDEHVVGTPRVQRLSLRTIGTPASGPGSSPAATAASTASAAAARVVVEHEVARVQLRLPGRDDGEVLLDARRGHDVSPAADRGRDVERGPLMAPRGSAGRGTGRLPRRGPWPALRRGPGSAGRRRRAAR